MQNSRKGFTLIETIVGMLVSALVLGGIYNLWKHNHIETLRLQARHEARNQLILASKKLSRSITLVGLGMPGIPAIERSDDVDIGTDTLKLYSNAGEQSSALSSDYSGGSTNLLLADGGIFSGATHVGISDGTHGELRRINSRSGSVIILNSAFSHDYSTTAARAYPATREIFYTDQDQEHLMRIVGGTAQIAGKQVHNFQVSFLDKDGSSTNTVSEIRTVTFSLTGQYEPIRGTLNSLVYTNTAIPRNLM
jgi:prepilin-type N-terminal cleavage/methylation domain-containing protein